MLVIVNITVSSRWKWYQMNIIRFIKLVIMGIIINMATGEIYLSGFLKFLQWRRVSAAAD